MVQKNVDKGYCVFPFCFIIADCVVRTDYKKEFHFHILWWHWRWFYRKQN